MKRENPSNTNLLPVFIWIHGGSSKHGNNTGDIWSEDSLQYDGRFLALQENIVFVSINYRVNSFGFLIWKGNKGTVISYESYAISFKNDLMSVDLFLTLN